MAKAENKSLDEHIEEETEDSADIDNAENEQYTQEENEMAEEAVETLNEDAGDYEHEADDTDSEDSINDNTSETTTKTYENGVASALGGFASMLKQFGVTEKIGEWVEKIADTVENYFNGKNDDSFDISDTADLVNDMYAVDSEEMLDSLNQSAALITSGQGDNGETIAGALGISIKESALSNPQETAQALQIYNNASEQAILDTYEEGSTAYNQAMASLGVVNQTLVESFYSTLLEGEMSGEHLLSEYDSQVVNTLNVTGVNTPYREYVPGDDISLVPNPDDDKAMAHEDLLNEGYRSNRNLQNADDAEILKTTGISAYMTPTDENKSVLGTGDFDPQRMHDLGVQDIDESADSNTLVSEQIDDGLTKMNSAYDTSNDQKLNDALHDSYAEMINGLVAYNDASVSEIQSKYGSDPEGKQNATDILAETMRTGFEKVFASLKESNDALDFLTDEDKEQLDNLKITGVNVKFSEYQTGMDLKTGDVVETVIPDSDEQYAQTLDANGTWGSNEQMYNSTFTDEPYGEASPSYQSDSNDNKTLHQRGSDEETEKLEERLEQGEAERQAEDATDIPYPGLSNY